MKTDFTKKLLAWDKRQNTRLMPWKNEKDPYRVWLSEIILQQTRVEQGWTYYEKFIKTFPTVLDLARAPEKKVFKLWEGLGYYSRCRNLIETAKKIAKDHKGKFPSSYEEISELKGIGPYTAAAIASFAFNLPYPVLDGNVHRVLARYFGISTALNTATEKKFYTSLALTLIDKRQPGIFNQALMDFGAVVCKPRQPGCTACVQSADCMAFQNGWVDLLPVKKKKLQRKERWFCYLVIETKKGEVYIRRRNQKDIWEDLYEFVLWERDTPFNEQSIEVPAILHGLLGKYAFTVTGISKTYKQQLTHQTIHGQFIGVRVEQPVPSLKDYQLVKRKQLSQFPFPRLIATYLRESLLALF
ncbi:MAG TPA: A/G-specific adenine glycosylase [Puia sp.]|nr:A/G-specific adenine glycosylase [Puia sp.]